MIRLYEIIRDSRRGYSESDAAEAVRIYNAAENPDYFTKMTPQQQRAIADLFWGK